VNEAYQEVVTAAVGVDVSTGQPAALREAIGRAEQLRRMDLVAWLCARLGDVAFGTEGVAAANHAYDRGHTADPLAVGPWVGRAQVAVATKEFDNWDRAMRVIRDQVGEEADPELVLRGVALLDVDRVRTHGADQASTWRVSATELEDAGAVWAAWHVWMAGVSALAHRDAWVALEAACEGAMLLATRHGLARGAIWACLELCQHLRACERPAEADLRVCGALELAEQLGDPDIVDLVLRMGCDLSTELGQATALIDRLRLRASVATSRGRSADQVGFLHQAFLAASRSQRPDAGSLGEELVETLLAAGMGAVPGLDVEALTGELARLGVLDHARQLALAASQWAFGQGRRGQAAQRLVDAARYALLDQDRDEARAMFDEAIRVSQSFGLDLHRPWQDERRQLFGPKP
jgi:hypothetical protein